MSVIPIGLSVKLAESSSEISSKIIQALLPDVTKYFNGISAELTQSIPDIIIKYITQQPEYTALISGSLQYEFGLPDPANRVNEILLSIKSGYIVKEKPVTAKSSSVIGGLKIQMIKKDFSDLLSLGSATLTTEKGDQLNWLQWLLLEGDSVIVSDHIFVFGPSPFSRTGMGLMRESVGGFWRVPPEYAGSINNNWITRAIEAASSEIDTTIQKILQK